MISRIYISLLFAASLGLSSAVVSTRANAADSKQTVSVIVHCKDLKIRSDARIFFQSNLRADSTKREISNLIKRFYFQWPIKDIQVKTDGNQFEFDIELKSTVTEFDVQGNHEINKAEIVRELKDTQDLYQGDNINRALLERAKTYYAFRGFPNAEVTIETLPRREAGTVKILVKVNENKPCLIQSLVFNGSIGEYWAQRIKKEFQWKNKMRCDQERVEAQIAEMRDDYTRENYFQFDIKNPKFDYLDAEKTKANFSADLTIGTRIVVDFVGNQFAFERNELMKRAIFLDQEKKFNQSFENSAIQSIKDFYEARGFPFAQVKFSRVSEENIQHLVFTIDRGPIIRLRSVRFDGNRDIKEKKLIKQFWTVAPEWTQKKVFVGSDVSTAVNGLLAYYQSMGYLHASFYEPAIDIQKEKHEAKILFKLQEGGPSYFDEFIVRNNVFIKTKDVEKFFKVKKGDPIDPVYMRDAAQRLEYEYQTNGFKYAKVKLPDVDSITEGYNQYVVEINEGPRIRFGDIIIRGNYSTHDYVISRELKFKSGDLFNPETINNTRSRLLRLGFFRSVTIEEKVRDDLQDVEDLIITVSEGKKRSIVVRPGVSTDEGARLTGSFGYTNIAGTGRGASVTGRINHRLNNDSIMEHRAIFSYLEPKLIGFYDGKLNLIHEQSEEDQFDISSTSVIVGLENTSMTHLRTAFQWQLEFRNPFDVQPGAIQNPLLDNTRARFGSLGSIIDVDFRDNLLNATKGTFHRLQLTYYDKYLLSDANFYQVFLRNSFYVPIYRRIRTVLSVRAGYSATFGQTALADQAIPIEKRFRLGGNTSLRGFGLNCVGGLPSSAAENCSDVLTSQAPGGNSMVNYLFDFLLPLSPSVDLVMFTDGGNAFLNNSDFSIWDIRTTAGFGLRYNTIVGPLRVDYGIKLDRRTGESFGEFHFAVGQF